MTTPSLDPSTSNYKELPASPISLSPTLAAVIPLSPNPWDDDSRKDPSPEEGKPKRLATLDSSLYDQPVFAGLKDNLPTSPSPEERKPKRLATLDSSLYEQPGFAGLNDNAPTTTSPEERQPKQPASLDSSLYEQPIFAGLLDHDPTTPGTSQEILSEFDPLASLEERNARDAWETAEGHPPPPRTPSPPVPPLKDLHIMSPTSADAATATSITSPSGFPSLAAFARSFSIPLRSRPQSLDASAKAMLSPATLSSFASQQEGAKADNGKGVSSDSSTPNRAGSGTASPVSKPTDGGFDFQKFLDQMKTKSADPVSKYLRSFLSNFAKRTFTVSDQVKIINDFLVFIASQMKECDVWKNTPESDFENAMEGMEKLVMNRLYDFTFTPQLMHTIPPRPITTDDLERDRVLAQRIALFDWLEERHLDIPEGEGSKGFLMFAEQELLKINHYKAPRDKLICILNSCKVIFGLIRHLHKEEGADSFVPILIFVVLKANPEHLLSNVEFINRFRNPAKLQSEAGYYLSSLMGAVSFIETMDHTSLSNISQDEFEHNVEQAIQSLPQSEPHSPNISFTESKMRGLHVGEESAQPLSISTPSHTLSEDAKRLLQKTGDTISKPLNAIGRIFSEALDGAENKLSYLPGPFAPFELGREQRAVQSGSGQWAPPESWQSGEKTPTRLAQVPQTPFGSDSAYNAPIQTPYKPRVRRIPSSPGYTPGPEETPSRTGPHTNQQLSMGPSQPINALLPPRVQSLAAEDGAHISRTPTPALDFAGVQAQIDFVHNNALAAARETLFQIFPGTDVEVVDWVLEANDGDLGKSIEQLLDIGGGNQSS